MVGGPLRGRVEQVGARILAAARQALARDGDTSMNQIAQLAGSAPAPSTATTRPASRWCSPSTWTPSLSWSTRSLATLPPVEALRRWATELVNAVRRKHGLGAALSPGAHQSITEQSYGPVGAAIAHPFDAGKRDSTTRADAEPADFSTSPGRSGEPSTGAEDRMLGLTLDGHSTRPRR
ncbi:hypothetical protein GCM10009848_37880 [Micromonospora lupini]